jgi:hypothetical protein
LVAILVVASTAALAHGGQSLLPSTWSSGAWARRNRTLLVAGTAPLYSSWWWCAGAGWIPLPTGWRGIIDHPLLTALSHGLHAGSGLLQLPVRQLMPCIALQTSAVAFARWRLGGHTLLGTRGGTLLVGFVSGLALDMRARAQFIRVARRDSNMEQQKGRKGTAAQAIRTTLG